MRLNLKLTHKVFILVAVPLVFELTFVSVLYELLRQSEAEAARATQARTVVTHLNKLLRLVINAATGLYAYNLTSGSNFLERYHKATELVPGEFAILEDAVRQQPKELAAVKRIKDLVYRGMDELDRCKNLIQQGEKEEFSDKIEDLKRQLGEIGKQVDEVVATEQEIDEASPKFQANARWQIKCLLLVGVVFNIMLAVCLAVFMNRSTTRRLMVLVDNTRRLAAGEPLNPPIAGSDEITHLDRVFNDMASSLDEAARERKEIERLKQEFVAMVSHDLRTPLASFRAFLQLLQADVYGTLNSDGQQRIAVAERNVDRLINLINDLLDIEKMEAGKLDMHLCQISIGSAVERSIDAVRGYAEQREVALENTVEDTHVFADEDRLVQVLVNLLSNAIKFSPAGGVVKVSASESAEWLEVRVTDQGCGIPESYHKYIFERFRQVEGTGEQKKGSSGLGLAICKAIIEQHGGSVGVESEEGHGSSFWFRIPAGCRQGADDGSEKVALASDALSGSRDP